MYVGNLAWSATENDIRELFSQYGTVSDVAIPTTVSQAALVASPS